MEGFIRVRADERISHGVQFFFFISIGINNTVLFQENTIRASVVETVVKIFVQYTQIIWLRFLLFHCQIFFATKTFKLLLKTSCENVQNNVLLIK
jgi:hypothetical protein